MNPQLRKPVETCTLKFPHQCRIHGGRIEGDWKAVYGETVSHPQ